jgi:hypothetical protein
VRRRKLHVDLLLLLLGARQLLDEMLSQVKNGKEEDFATLATTSQNHAISAQKLILLIQGTKLIRF